MRITNTLGETEWAEIKNIRPGFYQQKSNHSSKHVKWVSDLLIKVDKSKTLYNYYLRSLKKGTNNSSNNIALKDEILLEVENSTFRLGVKNPDYALNEPILRAVLNGYHIDISK